MDRHFLKIGKTKDLQPIEMSVSMANRHGLIAGATGTGKTVTLQRMIDEFSRIGVPVFTADIKGDLAGLSIAGGNNQKVTKRFEDLEETGLEYAPNPTVLWDLYGQAGLPLRATISEVGPSLLAQMLGLNDTQEGVLHVLFNAADKEGLLLLDLKDLSSLLSWGIENFQRLSKEHGFITKQSLGVIQRSLLTLESAGAGAFFGEPCLSINHLMQRDYSGRGVVNVLDATRVISSPRIYCAFLMWLLSELFESLPEVGDVATPKLVFFFDEAHLLFKDAPSSLIEKIERLVKLIRSKGVGVYFITQNPADIPDSVSAQLGHRIQHALRSYSESERKALKSIAQALRTNPKFDNLETLENLAIGEALISLLDSSGIPSQTEKVLILPPGSRLGPISSLERQTLIDNCPLKQFYGALQDRESAYEILSKRRDGPKDDSDGAKAPKQRERQGFLEAFFKSTARAVGSQVGRQIVRGILGTITRGARL